MLWFCEFFALYALLFSVTMQELESTPVRPQMTPRPGQGKTTQTDVKRSPLCKWDVSWCTCPRRDPPERRRSKARADGNPDRDANDSWGCKNSRGRASRWGGIQAQFVPPVTLREVLADVCVCLFLQNVSLSQLQEDRQRDRRCLPLSSRGQDPGLHALLYLVLVRVSSYKLICFRCIQYVIIRS